MRESEIQLSGMVHVSGDISNSESEVNIFAGLIIFFYFYHSRLRSLIYRIRRVAGAFGPDLFCYLQVDA